MRNYKCYSLANIVDSRLLQGLFGLIFFGFGFYLSKAKLKGLIQPTVFFLKASF
jgi:hypothetical protein